MWVLFEFAYVGAFCGHEKAAGGSGGFVVFGRGVLGGGYVIHRLPSRGFSMTHLVHTLGKSDAQLAESIRLFSSVSIDRKGCDSPT